jgi:flagellin-like protein
MLMTAKRRGVSPVIATLLLIVIAVAAAVLTYIWVTGYMGTLQSQAGAQQVQERIKIEAIDITNNKVYIRNIGETKVTIAAVYLIDSTTGSTIASNTTVNIELSPGELTDVGLTLSDNVKSGATYIVKAVTAKGTEATYQFTYRE